MIDRFDLVVFDCDGVVVDSEVLACRTLAETLSEHGLPIGTEEVFERFLGRSFSEVDAYARARLGTSLPESFRGALRTRLEAAFRTSLKPIDGVREVLSTIDRPFCLASSSDPARISLTLAVAGMTVTFGDRVFSASQVRKGKPLPDLFLYAAEMMAKAPSRTLVIEDTVPGVLAGKAAGMMVWGFTGGSHCAGRDVGRKLQEAGADRILDRMSAFFVV